MLSDAKALYNALAARDARFDGVFFVGVTSTGIYCRPICPAKTPKAANCRFFNSAETAEKASFRPCLRCRPELAPGTAPVDDAHRIASLVAQRIEEGMLDEGEGLEYVAKQFGWSSRQIRRIVHHELGVSPMELVLTRRLLLAKQLLTETTLGMSAVAYSSGFASVRRFNDAFNKRYGMPPSALRKVARHSKVEAGDPSTFTLQLSYRAPFDWDGLLHFLEARLLKGVESLENESYARTVQLGEHTGWLRVTNDPARSALRVEMTHSLTPVLPRVLTRLRHLFDLNARPDVINARLSADAELADCVEELPGLRVPGAFDSFEMALRAILGQQITVKAATTLAGRVVAALGAPITTNVPGLTHLSPVPASVAALDEEKLAALGITKARARTIGIIAREMASNQLILDPGASADAAMEQLIAIPGIGPWTAHYIAMRALRWPDAFPKEDVVLRKNLGGVTAARADEISQAWRPWRSYATLHLWRRGPRGRVAQ